VAISHVALTDGLITLRERRSREKKLLGRKAPTHGFPQFDRPRNGAMLSLQFPAAQ